jgi:iron complex transport system substrate-binding protein
VDALRRRIDLIANRTARLPPAQRRSVICLEWTMPLMAAGNWTPKLVEFAGGEAGLAAAGEHSRYVTWDEVRACEPEVLIIAPCGFDLKRSQSEAALLRGLPGFNDLPAVRHGRTFVIDGSAYLNRSGPRLVESLEILAHLIQPTMFAPPAGDAAEGRAWSRLA